MIFINEEPSKVMVYGMAGSALVDVKILLAAAR